jgi:glycosyltransferase involved in cell wall biosynthesis
MKAMLSVLQVTPALESGGVERTTIEVAQALTRAGGKAYVASRGGRLAGELAEAGGVLAELPMDTKNPLTVAANAFRLAELVRQWDINIVHARSRAPAWSALWAARHLRVPFVTTYHGVYNARTGLKRWYNGVMARGDVVIANSEYTRAHILREHKVDPSRVVAIPRGVDLARFDPALVDPQRTAELRRGWGIEAGDRRPIVLLPGRLTRWKGQRVLIEAAGMLEQERRGRALYVLAGDAQGRHEYTQELEGVARDRGVAESVRIVGHVADMPAAFAAADLAVFPSTDPEAFGRGAVEAQAMGKPVIASDSGGYTETIEAGVSGLLTPPGDAGALAAAIAEVLDMPAEARVRMGEAGAARVRSRYSVAALQQGTLRVYARVLEARS